MRLAVFAESLPAWFLDHARTLADDLAYRAMFQSAVQAMDYHAWLQSPKWKQTARFLKMCQPWCERCGCDERNQLEAHHKTYEHIGIEILYLADLEVLCRRCHGNRHQLPLPLFSPARTPTPLNHHHRHAIR